MTKIIVFRQKKIKFVNCSEHLEMTAKAKKWGLTKTIIPKTKIPLKKAEIIKMESYELSFDFSVAHKITVTLHGETEKCIVHFSQPQNNLMNIKIEHVVDKNKYEFNAVFKRA